MKDEFFSLPLFPPSTLCDEDNFQGTANCGCNCGSTAGTNCGNCGSRTSGCGCNR
ncbi:MAG: hypothetical protein IJS41_01370 [Clostridia bacterium]|nr:hypothetical protein [Clostridia bacterium]